MPPTALHVLVVDDEPRVRQRLTELLQERDTIQEVHTADSGPVAIDMLRSRDFDLVFLDIQMPGATGVDVVEEVGPDRMPLTVFATAYDEYALRAFDLAAIDYLLKPFDDARFERALTRATEAVRHREARNLTQQFEQFLQASNEHPPSARPSSGSPDGDSGGSASLSDSEPDDAPSTYIRRLTVDLPGKMQVIPIEDIRFITAEGVCVKIHTADTTYLLRERMHVLDDRLPPDAFARIHRSTIVRLDLVDTLLHRSGGDYAVRLHDRTTLKVSRSRREELLERLQRGTPER